MMILDKQSFEEVITKAKNIIDPKSGSLLLSNFFIEFNGLDCIVKAANLDHFLILKTQLSQSPANYQICINSKKLIDIVKSLPAPTFMMDVVNKPDNNFVQIQSGRSKFKLSLADNSEYPQFPTFEDNYIKIGLHANVLLDGLESTEYCTAKGDTPVPILDGIYLTFDKSNKTVEFVATDLFRLATYKMRLDDDSLIEDVAFVIPKKSVKILKAIADRNALVNIYYKPDGSYLVFEGEGQSWILLVRLLEGEFPEYQSYLNQERLLQAKIKKQVLQEMIKRLSCGVEGSVIPVKFSFKDDLLVGQVTDREVEITDEIDIEYGYDPVEVELNARYLHETLHNAPFDEFIHVKMGDLIDSVLVELANGDYKVLIATRM